MASLISREGEEAMRKQLQDAFLANLTDATIADVMKHKRSELEVVELTHNQRVSDALEILSDNNILSAPVVLSASAEDHEGGAYLGMIGVESMLYYLVRDEKGESLDDFFDRLLITVTDKDAGCILEIEQHNSLADLVCKAFFGVHAAEHKDTKPRDHVHRVSVFDDKGKICGILSQSDVVRYLFRKLSRRKVLEPFFSLSAADLGLGRTAPSTITFNNTSALQAFRTMAKERCSGLGIVEDGKLVANISASDLRGLTRTNFAHLVGPLKEYVGSGTSVFAVKAEDTLQEIFETLIQRKVHRLYVTDEEDKPCGVITLTDLLVLIFLPISDAAPTKQVKCSTALSHDRAVEPQRKKIKLNEPS
eukprot:gb/GEZN01008120.1/.p1 GENE.gb/GEZN01008120.1/~~gb/GEZN01008120.1/.p1  ORF type:complete len:363 (+),score=42.13 gb/GEZN01008120.1/:44-1132(+)